MPRSFIVNIFSWLSSFLSGRYLRVKYKECYSSRFLALSGVPQGSHLGPLLFNLFINDICNVFVHSKFLLYADDLKIFLSVRNRDDSLLLQHDLDRLSDWCDTNKLVFNLSKCNVVRFSRKRVITLFDYKICSAQLTALDRIKDLGVIFSSQLSFRDHCQYIVGRALKVLGYVLRVSRHFKLSSTVKLLYVSLVRPHLEYAAIVWCPHFMYLSVMVERVQHKFLRFMSFKLKDPMPVTCHNYQPILTKLRLMSLENVGLFLICYLYTIC